MTKLRMHFMPYKNEYNYEKITVKGYWLYNASYIIYVFSFASAYNVLQVANLGSSHKFVFWRYTYIFERFETHRVSPHLGRGLG